MEHNETYKANKSAKVGDEIVCPICGKNFIKKQYAQAFCCGQCKDKFWNCKEDRHDPSYYKIYDAKDPKRMARRKLYGENRVTSFGGGLRTFEELLIDKECLEIYEGDC